MWAAPAAAGRSAPSCHPELVEGSSSVPDKEAGPQKETALRKREDGGKPAFGGTYPALQELEQDGGLEAKTALQDKRLCGPTPRVGFPCVSLMVAHPALAGGF